MVEAAGIPEDIYDVTISSHSNPSSSIEPTLSNSNVVSSFNYSSE